MKFEYEILEAPASGFLNHSVDSQEVVNKLNEPSLQGWEVVSTVDTTKIAGYNHYFETQN